ncbi:MAG: sigma-70 family RNA polymerase sigma factor [Planctomycetes bacterium]|nr:sigma-70 family RNA polymerase sigma factor [Planctomycetota bacterium]
MVRSLAIKFRRGCDSIDDAISVANIGLLKAAARYDPYRGTTFGAYAKFIITMELRQHGRKYNSMIRLSRDLKVLISRIAQTTESLMHNYGRHPTSREIAESLHISERTVIQAIEAAANRRISSLEDVSSEAANISRRPACTFQRPNASDAGVTASSDLRDALEKLTARSRALIVQYYFEGWTQSRIANEWGTTQSQISREIKNAVSVLRQLMDTNDKTSLPVNCTC